MIDHQVVPLSAILAIRTHQCKSNVARLGIGSTSGKLIWLTHGVDAKTNAATLWPPKPYPA
jgi:hypothetical protein